MGITVSNAKISKSNLGYLGVDFQYRLISAFFEEPSFFKDMYQIIDQNMFTESYLKTVVGVMKEYYAKYESTASYDILMFKLKEKANTENDVQCFTEVVEKLKNTSTEGIQEIESLAQKFFMQQNWIRVSNEIRRIAGDGDISKYDECQRLMEEAMSVGRHTEEAESPLDDIDRDLSKDNIVTIPTGVGKLDEVLGGGIDKGKIGLIIAPSSFGKTSMTTGFAAYEASCRCESNNNNGFRILQIVFEDSNRDINRKYFSRLSQVETKDLNKSEEITQHVKELLLNHPDFELIKNNIKVMHLDSGEYSASDIKDIIKRKINEGFKPDVVIIDYFECLEAEKGTMKLAKWEQENKTMRKLETLAKQLDVAIWLPTQGNRGSFNSEIVTMDQSGGSIGKIQIAQVVLSVARSVEDIKNQRATISVLKNRSGSAGIVLNGIKFDNGTCTISDDNTIDFDSALEYNEYAEEQENNATKALIDGMRGPHRNYIE